MTVGTASALTLLYYYSTLKHISIKMLRVYAATFCKHKLSWSNFTYKFDPCTVHPRSLYWIWKPNEWSNEQIILNVCYLVAWIPVGKTSTCTVILCINIIYFELKNNSKKYQMIIRNFTVIQNTVINTVMSYKTCRQVLNIILPR